MKLTQSTNVGKLACSLSKCIDGNSLWTISACVLARKIFPGVVRIWSPALGAPMIGIKGMHVVQVHGGYVAHNQVMKPAKQAQDDDVATRLWDVSCKLTHLTPVSL